MKSKTSAITQKAEELGQLTYNERKNPQKELHIKQCFKYIDEENCGMISCTQFARFLSQNGVVIDEQGVYDIVVGHRMAKQEKGTYFEKPTITAITIKEDEFKEIMLQKGLPSADVKELKNIFAQLGAITPGLLNESGVLNVTQLWNQMKFWGIMTDAEIEQVRCFFNVSGKPIDKFLDGLQE